jgi:putative pantetheine hydrolase
MSGRQPGRTNSLVDVPGLRVGHAQRIGAGWLTGSTVVLTGPGGAVGGVDVRGGGPGTRETDLLDPRNQVERVHALLLTGGSAFGLAAADGVMSRLAAAGVGFPVGTEPGQVVPIVPGAVVFDLSRGGDFSARPDASFGELAHDDALGPAGADVVRAGAVGAGTGAVAGGLKGGVGSASEVLVDGTAVGALVVVNAVGSTVDLRSGELLGARHLLDGELPALRPPAAADLAAARAAAASRPSPQPPLATTLVVVGTDRALTKAQCQKVAGIGHDGLARAIDPVHTMFDGDTAFALATAAREAPEPVAFHALLGAAADCVTRAVVHAMLAARTVETPAGAWRCYRDVFPSACSGVAGSVGPHDVPNPDSA